MKSFLRNNMCMTLALGGALLIALSGCNQDGSESGGRRTSDGKSDAPPTGKPMKAPDKMGNATPQPDNKTAVAQNAPRKTEAPAKMENASESSPPSAQKAAAVEPAPPPPQDDVEQKRGQAEDMIYATIRVKMEEAITERAKLLKEGRDPADERIRQLEGTIMRARELLIENGEIVSDVVPPIVQVQK